MKLKVGFNSAIFAKIKRKKKNRLIYVENTREYDFKEIKITHVFGEKPESSLVSMLDLCLFADANKKFYKPAKNPKIEAQKLLLKNVEQYYLIDDLYLHGDKLVDSFKEKYLLDVNEKDYVFEGTFYEDKCDHIIFDDANDRWNNICKKLDGFYYSNNKFFTEIGEPIFRVANGNFDKTCSNLSRRHTDKCEVNKHEFYTLTNLLKTYPHFREKFFFLKNHIDLDVFSDEDLTEKMNYIYAKLVDISHDFTKRNNFSSELKELEFYFNYFPNVENCQKIYEYLKNNYELKNDM